jgi:hypothetical protein
MSEDPFGDAIGTKEPRSPRQMPQLPWVQIIIAAVVVVALIVSNVVTSQGQKSLESQIVALNSKVVSVGTELAAVKASVQGEISGLTGSVQNVAATLAGLDTGADSWEEIAAQLNTLSGGVDEIHDLIVAGNFTAMMVKMDNLAGSVAEIKQILVTANLTAPEA